MRYFAYGSNMSTPRLRARLPRAQRLATARLPGYRLTFAKRGADGSGKCDAEATGQATDVVYGVLWELAADDGAILDRIEGRGHGYERRQVTLQDADGENVEAFLYVATDIDRDLPPYAWYREHVLRGAREHGLPAGYIQGIEAVPTITDPDTTRCARELAIYA